MSFFKKALKSAGKVTKIPGKALTVAAKPVNKVGSYTKKVPIVGNGIHAVYSSSTAAPINFATRFARNPKNVHRAAYDGIKQHIKDTQALAPYAQGVMSLTPGVGTGISAGIGAGLALSKGRSINDAIKEGIKGAIPGGPLLQGTFNVVSDISAGKPISKVQLDTLSRAGVPDAATFSTDLRAAVKGDIKALARVNSQINKMKADGKKAVQVGVAVGTATKLQSAHAKGVVQSKEKIKKAGLLKIKANPILQTAMKVKIFAPGFPYGIGIMTFKLNAVALAQFRGSLTTAQKIGFDAGVACHVGMTSREPIPGASPMQQLGYFITEGLKGSTNAAMKKTILRVLAKNSETKSGAAAVVKEITAEKGWWAKVIEWFKDNF